MKKKLTPEQLKERRKAQAFQKKIRNVFLTAGFTYLDTEHKHIKIGNRKLEVDAVFLYENIILICEDTARTNKIKDHIRSKKQAFDEIENNLTVFIEELCNNFSDKAEILKKYSLNRYKIFNLYFSQSELDLCDDDLNLYSNIIFIEPKTLNYFHRMAQCIKKSVRYEIFKFLNIASGEIGLISSESSKKSITAPIIYPKDLTGLKNGVRIVSFMMSAETLIKTCYVMRKDNWEDAIWLYQRLIDKNKIKNIREFLIKNEETFFNNIIVGLPDSVRFENSQGDSFSIDKIGDYENCSMIIPDTMNSICVIDGQHRIYAHYEGNENDKNEQKISELRKKLHLLVTGLIFPPTMGNIQKTQIQSEIFLDINSNSKPVQADVLLHIKMLKYPYSDIGLARRIIEKLNRSRVFLNRFELSPLDEAKDKSKIKVASIVKFALRYLVTINPSDGRVSLYTYWDGDKAALKNKDNIALDEYIKFCVKQLDDYFSAIRMNFTNAWEDSNSRILSVTSINGFIIAYNRQLLKNGLKDFIFFENCFKKLSIDFSKDNFGYASSQYQKFSKIILEQAFGIKDENKPISEVAITTKE